MSDIRTTIKTVSPTQAKTWLEENDHNRPIKQDRVKYYADAMTRGEWEMNGETIKFDSSGKLLDGQHRLHAIVQSNKSVPLMVVNGIPRKYFDTIDRGASRSYADLLAIEGATHARDTAAALRWLYHYRRRTLENMHDLSSRPTATQILEMYKVEKGITPAINGAKQLKLYQIMPQSIASLLFYVLTEIKPEKGLEFLSGLVDEKIEYEKKHPVRMLRDYLWNAKLSRERFDREEVLGMCFKAWNAFIAKEKPDSLAWRKFGSKEAFPYPRGGK